KIGSTLKGIGPTYMDKTGRNGIRVGDLESENWLVKYRNLANKHQKMVDFYDVEIEYNLEELEKEFFDSIEVLKSLNFTDSEEYIFNAQSNSKSILAEGAQGSLLDIDFGTYPYVTSSNTTAAGACTGLGVAPNAIKKVYGIFKAYTTRVGSGPFPTELFDEDGETMGRVGKEFGATTGRSRRCGWLDIVALKYACQINGVTELMMMKADVLSGFKTIKVCTSYLYKGKEIKHFPYNIEQENVEPIYKNFNGWKEDLTQKENFESLPKNLIEYINFIEKELNIPISIVSVGPDRKQTIFV
ncbi:adenylosuccinate synthetase, partial [Flavobacteriaceae bacterium]|nr:adenylosuccinate synthetase [Flavobacteriaceae bacterium]